MGDAVVVQKERRKDRKRETEGKNCLFVGRMIGLEGTMGKEERAAGGRSVDVAKGDDKGGREGRGRGGGSEEKEGIDHLLVHQI